MANIKITELQPSEFAELYDLQLEAIVGGRMPRLPKCFPKFPFPKFPRF